MTEEVKTKEKKEEPKLVKFNLACGQNKLEGYINVDMVKTEAADKVMNLEQYPWDIPSDSVDEIIISHYVEHVTDLIKFMNELHRIMKKGAKAFIVVPYGKSTRALQDPTHKRSIVEESFLYYNQNWLKTNKLDHYGVTADFDFTYGYSVYPEWQNRSQEAIQFALKHYWNVASDLHVTLIKK